ncbi:MAG: class I SAM-dependent methyltransferase [Patescibacteria group bacterium]|nr:class I SAM-dependent methyltransferase [Patescibacteria group bacterium]
MRDKVDKIKHTIDYYDREAKNWSLAHCHKQSDTFWRGEMEKLHKLLPHGKILEIGSGSGKDATALISLGYDYIGTDASEGLLKVAKKANPTAKFIPIAVHDLDFKNSEFDGFWSVATLLHIPKDKIDGALKQIKKVVRSGGIGFISLKAGAGERTDPDTGRWFAYYSLEEFHAVLERNGFEVIEEATRKGDKDWWLEYWVKTL